MTSRLVALASLVAVSAIVSLVSGCSSDAESPAPGTSPTPSGTSSTSPTATATPTTSPAGDASAPPPATGGDAETPATGDAATVKAWLESKAYTKWACEPAPHPGRAGTGHSANRICSNGLLSRHGAGEYPVGAASVKELYATPQSAAPYGHAVMVHAQAGGCDTWFYFEQVNGNVVADGVGVDGCAGCHEGAGTDATHTGHDCVYTQVK